jgi:hypothetical protein
MKFTGMLEVHFHLSENTGKFLRTFGGIAFNVKEAYNFDM